MTKFMKIEATLYYINYILVYVVGLFSIFMTLGAVGGLERNSMTFIQFDINILISFGLMIVACILYRNARLIKKDLIKRCRRMNLNRK